MRRPTGRLAVANRAIREAAVSLDVAVARRHQARRGIEAVDMVLDAVERHHLTGRPRHAPPRPEWIAWLEQEGGLSVPAHIMELTNTVRLHDALMDWQGELLDTASPARAQLTPTGGEGDARQRRRGAWLDVA